MPALLLAAALGRFAECLTTEGDVYKRQPMLPARMTITFSGVRGVVVGVGVETGIAVGTA